MKKLLFILIINCCLFFTACSRTENPVTPISKPPADINWVKTGLDSNTVISIFQTDNGKILAGTNFGLFASLDSGFTWQKVDQFPSSAAVTCFKKIDQNNIIARTNGKGLYITSDNGKSWLNAGSENLNVTAIEVNNEGEIFAATRGKGIYCSSGIYSPWQSVDETFSAQTFSSLLIIDNNVLFAGGTGVYRSTDNGINWEIKNKGLGNWSVQSLTTNKLGNIYAGTDNGGFFISGDKGENWAKSNNGLTNTEITCLALNTQGHIFAGT